MRDLSITEPTHAVNWAGPPHMSIHVYRHSDPASFNICIYFQLCVHMALRYVGSQKKTPQNIVKYRSNGPSKISEAR